MMNLKLFIVMGVSWLLEIFASLFNEHSIWWSIADFFNLMQGVLVFFIFVFKRNVLVAFQKKLGKCDGLCDGSNGKILRLCNPWNESK